MSVPTIEAANKAFKDNTTVILLLDETKAITGKIVGVKNSKEDGFLVLFDDTTNSQWIPLERIEI